MSLVAGWIQQKTGLVHSVRLGDIETEGPREKEMRAGEVRQRTECKRHMRYGEKNSYLLLETYKKRKKWSRVIFEDVVAKNFPQLIKMPTHNIERD